MDSVVRFFTVVLLMDDDNEDVCIVSQTWLSDDSQYARIPSFVGTRYTRAVRSHETLPEGTPWYKIEVKCNCIFYEDALNSERLLVADQFPSSDGTCPLGLREKRIPCPTRFSTSEEDVDERAPRKNTCEKSFSFTKVRAHHFQRPSTSHTASVTSQHGDAERPATMSEIQHALDTRFAALFKVVNAVNDKLKDLSLSLSTVQATCTTSAMDFPITSIEDFNWIEKNFQLPSVRQQLSAIMATTPGDTTIRLVRNLMSRMISRSVGIEINFSGAGRKLAFRKTLLKEFITQEVLKRQTSSVGEVQSAMQAWLHDCNRFGRPAKSSLPVDDVANRNP